MVLKLVSVHELFVFAILRGIILRGIHVWVPILRFEVRAYKTTCLFKVRCIVEVLLPTLDFRFHTTTGLTPLTKVGCGFFVAPLVSELLILVVEPELLKLLLLDVSGREIRKVA